MTRDQIRAEIEEIERSAMQDQRGWKEYLGRLSDRAREVHLETLLKRTDFERWLVFKAMLSETCPA